MRAEHDDDDDRRLWANNATVRMQHSAESPSQPRLQMHFSEVLLVSVECNGLITVLAGSSIVLASSIVLCLCLSCSKRKLYLSLISLSYAPLPFFSCERKERYAVCERAEVILLKFTPEHTVEMDHPNGTATREDPLNRPTSSQPSAPPRSHSSRADLIAACMSPSPPAQPPSIQPPAPAQPQHLASNPSSRFAFDQRAHSPLFGPVTLARFTLP